MNIKLDNIIQKVHDKTELRYTNKDGEKDMNFLYVHQTDVFDLIEEAYQLGRNSPKENIESPDSAELSKLKRLIAELEIPRVQYVELEKCVNSLPCGENNTSSPKLPELEEVLHAALGGIIMNDNPRIDCVTRAYNFIAGKIGR